MEILTLPHRFRNQALFHPVICHLGPGITSLCALLRMVLEEGTGPAMIAGHAIGRY
jgi:hypothetical protein